MVSFHWYCSYLDQVSYRVNGITPVREIEAYRSNPFTLEYFRSIFNDQGDPTAFDREVLSRQGGVAIIYSVAPEHPRRWTLELYAAFVQHLKARHVESLAECARIWAKAPEVTHEDHPPLVIPRPIFYSPMTHKYETEPWYSIPPETTLAVVSVPGDATDA